MKKLTALLIVFILCSGCNLSNRNVRDKDYALAVVATSESTHKSTITFYDEMLKPIQVNQHRLASLGRIGAKVHSNEKTSFLPVAGDMKGVGGGKIIAADKHSGLLETITIGKGRIKSLDLSTDSLYVAHTLNNQSTLSQVNLKNYKITKEVELTDEFIDYVVVNEEKVITLSYTTNPITSTIARVYDLNLNLLKSETLAVESLNATDGFVWDNKIIFTPSTSKSIVTLDCETLEIGSIDLPIDPSIVKEILINNSEWYLLTTSEEKPNVSTIIHYNPNTETIISSVNIDAELNNLTFIKSRLYAFRTGVNTPNTLFAFDLNNGLKETQRITLDLQNTQYTSSILIP